MRIRNVVTGSIWQSANPGSGVWQKVWAGIEKGTMRVGGVSQNFHPLHAKKHVGKFEMLSW